MLQKESSQKRSTITGKCPETRQAPGIPRFLLRQIVALADYARRQAANGPQTRRKAIILPVLQDFAKKNTACLKVTDCGDLLHAELDLEVSFVLDTDDTAMRTVIMLAKGICMESRKNKPGIIHIELDYE